MALSPEAQPDSGSRGCQGNIALRRPACERNLAAALGNAAFDAVQAEGAAMAWEAPADAAMD